MHTLVDLIIDEIASRSSHLTERVLHTYQMAHFSPQQPKSLMSKFDDKKQVVHTTC